VLADEPAEPPKNEALPLPAPRTSAEAFVEDAAKASPPVTFELVVAETPTDVPPPPPPPPPPVAPLPLEPPPPAYEIRREPKDELLPTVPLLPATPTPPLAEAVCPPTVTVTVAGKSFARNN